MRTANDIWWSRNPQHDLNADTDKEMCMKDYARQVAEAVRQECAEKAQVIQVDSQYNNVTGRRDPVFGIDQESILLIDIEQFIK